MSSTIFTGVVFVAIGSLLLMLLTYYVTRSIFRRVVIPTAKLFVGSARLRTKAALHREMIEETLRRT